MDGGRTPKNDVALVWSGGTLTVSNGAYTAAFGLGGTYARGNFHIASDGHGGTGVTFE